MEPALHPPDPASRSAPFPDDGQFAEQGRCDPDGVETQYVPGRIDPFQIGEVHFSELQDGAPRLRQVAVKSRRRDAEAVRYVFDSDFRIAQQSLCRSQVFGGEGRRAPAETAASFRRVQAGAGALADDAALELGQSRS